MTEIDTLVRSWMRTFQVELDSEWTEDTLKLCKRLVLEESAEAMAEFDRLLWGYDDPRDLAKELGDTIWVCLYAMHKLGLSPRRVMKAIYASNMSKLDDNFQPILDKEGKIQKGPNYIPTNLDWMVGGEF